MIKRLFDLIAAVAGLILCGPLLLVIAALVKWDSTGPVFFRQARVGRGFRVFYLYKFRTMRHEPAAKGSLLTVGEDHRVTRVGTILRRYKLDELPQLFNVLKGEMSIVGPRPEVPRYVSLFHEEYVRILAIRPGLTDLASLKFIDEAALLGRAERPEEEYKRVILPEKLRLAQLYIKHASFLFDLSIIVQTLLRLVHVRLVVCELPELAPRAQALSSYWDGAPAAFVLKWRRVLIVGLDLLLIVLANYLAFWLRFDGAIPPEDAHLWMQTLPWLLVMRGIAFSVFRLNEGLWRYTSIWDLQNIVSGVLVSTAVFYAWIQWGIEATGYPRSILFIDSLLLIAFITGVRLPSRLLREKVIYRQKKNVLIVGAGDAGERIVREMKTHASYRYHPIGLVDDKPSLLNQRIHGVKVLGTPKDLAAILTEKGPEEIVLALPSAKPDRIREIIAELEPFKIPIKTLPNWKDLLVDKSALSQIRNLALTDLLPRAAVNFNAEAVRHMISGKRVLITGAGGSIGAELSRQIAALQPESLVLYERHENSLYTIGKELDDKGFSAMVRPVIGDVTDKRRLCSVMAQSRPHILFHAAAHKHVPLVELNPAEALKNNCLGTRTAAMAADRFEVERFVLISTDKAVNPSSVMGATKRVAEVIVQDIARRSRTRFLTVRFGNVLGSNGSVLLRFQEQIKAGGPVTVTHPGVQRYFMLIPEAVHLVLQAASLGEQGAIYVLDMGEQIRVLDLARNVIRLSGLVPGEEIPIRFVGLRPGEKLSEELVGEGETAEPSPVQHIRRIRTFSSSDVGALDERIMGLEAAAVLNNPTWAIERLQELVPTFRPTELPTVQASAPQTALRCE